MTAAVPKAPSSVSMRMPASLPPLKTRSLGHLTMIPGHIPSKTRATAAPAATARGEMSRASGKRHASESASPRPIPECQRLPRRPRPAVWISAISTSPGTALAALASMIVFVDPATSRTSTRPRPCTPLKISWASRRSGSLDSASLSPRLRMIGSMELMSRTAPSSASPDTESASHASLKSMDMPSAPARRRTSATEPAKPRSDPTLSRLSSRRCAPLAQA